MPQINSTRKPSRLTANAVKNHRTGTLADAPPNAGLRLVASDKRKSWIYRYRTQDGRLEQTKLGEYPAVTLKKARELHNDMKELRRAGKSPKGELRAERIKKAEASAPKPDAYTIRKMFDEYLAAKALIWSPKNTEDITGTVNFNIGALAGRRPEEVSYIELDDHIRAIGARAPEVARRFRAEFVAAWNWAMSKGRKIKAPCPVNSLSGDLPKKKPRQRDLKESELKILLPWMREHYSATTRDALMLSLYTGMRPGEVRGLHTSEIAEDKDGWRIVIPAERMKGDRPHLVPLVGTALKIAQARLDGGYLFSGRKGREIARRVIGGEVFAHRGTSNAKVHSHLTICPVADWTPHDMRRTAATILASLECPFWIIETILAHKLPGVSGTYNVYSYAKERREWLRKLGARLDGLGGTMFNEVAL